MEEQSEPIPFSNFVLKRSTDSHLLRVMARIGIKSLSDDECKTSTLANMWLADQQKRWGSLHPDAKSRLVQDLLEVLYREDKSFDALFNILYAEPILMFFASKPDYMEISADILRSGLDYSFLIEGQLQNVLDFPFKQIYWHFSEILHLNQCPVNCMGFSACHCPRFCSCRYPCPCSRRPLYIAIYYGLPKLVRLLMNRGARLPQDDVCHCPNSDGDHPLVSIFLLVAETGKTIRWQRDVLSLQLVLVDAPASFRHTIRSKFWYLGDVMEEIPSLKHMARASVRQQLRSSRAIGKVNALASCGLPKSLESYINIDEFELDVECPSCPYCRSFVE